MEKKMLAPQHAWQLGGAVKWGEDLLAQGTADKMATSPAPC